ncbi:MAG: Hpt domain-containing protein [Pseudoflavonifractor sp.]
MDQMLEELTRYGADVTGAMGRFLGDIDLYKTCFATFVEDEAFSKLGEALQIPDYEKAFECAHTLKGVTGNMGLTPLYEVICSIVEALRGGAHADLQGHYAEILAQLNWLKGLV